MKRGDNNLNCLPQGVIAKLKKDHKFWVLFLLIWWCLWKCLGRCQAYYIFTSLEFAFFSKRTESHDKGRLRRRGRTSSYLWPYPREDFRLKVTKPSIMKAPRNMGLRVVPLPVLLLEQMETMGHWGAVTFSVACLQKGSLMEPSSVPQSPQTPSSHWPHPPVSARAGHSVAILLGKPSFPHLYFNICSLSHEKLEIYL